MGSGGRYEGERQVRRARGWWGCEGGGDTSGAVQGSKDIPASLDLHCSASANFISILARVRASVAEESTSYSTIPSCRAPRPRIINQPLMV